MKIPLLIGLAGIVGAVVASQADSLLEKHTKELQNATALDAIYTVQNLPGGPQEYKLKLAKPAKFRLETPDEVVVGNGMTVWTYKKAQNVYTEVPQESGDLKKLFKRESVIAWTAFFDKDPFKDVTGVKVGTNRILKGKAVTEVSFVFPGKPERDATLFIDQTLGVARGLSMKTAPDKETIVMAKDLSIASSATKDSDFQFSIPDGAKKLDPSALASTTFAKVGPIFQTNCAGCHNSTRPRSGLDLTTYAAAMAGGKGGKDIIPGDPDSSPIMAYLKAQDKPIMPPGGALSDSDIATIAGWIKGGAKEN